jgi:tryptophan-rich sensory protein
MNQKNNLSELSDEKLLKRRDLLKGLLIGMYAVCILLIVLLLYIFFVKDFSKISLTTFIPVLMLPVITLPLLFQVNTLNKEIKSRNLE